MRVIEPSFRILDELILFNSEEALRRIERAGRICYKTEHMIEDSSARDFVRRLIHRGHHSVLEHVSFSVMFVCDRGVTHELVRHRLASYSQESTRYCNYSNERFGKEITVIRPTFWSKDSEMYKRWLIAMRAAEVSYLNLLAIGCTPQEARTVLPNSLKTEIIVTANIREWRHILSLRASVKAHPQIRELMTDLLYKLNSLVPVLFEDVLDEIREVPYEWEEKAEG